MTNWVAAEVLASVLNGILQGIVVAGATWIAMSFARLSAAARYAIWMAALATVAFLPAANLAWSSHTTAQVSAAPAPAIPAVALPEPGPWVVWLFAAWASVSALLLLRLALSYAALLRLKARAAEPAEAIGRRYELLAGRRGRGVALRSADIRVPVAVGLWRPAVLLPASLASELSAPELDQVLLHELAHLRRRDDWTTLFQRLVESVFFFHPAVLWIGRRLELQREIACDDSVVTRTGAAAPYAACLVKVARGALARRGPRLAHAAVSGKREFAMRIEALVAATRVARTSRAALAAGLAFLAASAAVAVRLGPFSVELPALAMSVPRAAVDEPTLASRRAEAAPAVAAVRPRARRTVVARRTTPPRTSVVAVRDEPAAPQVLPAVTESTYYVFYWNEGGARWIRIVWVQAVPERPPLNGA